MRKILQIMPAPVGMEALFRGEHGEEQVMPVTCLALVYDFDIQARFIEACVTSADGATDEANASSNFIGVRVKGFKSYEMDEGVITPHAANVQ